MNTVKYSRYMKETIDTRPLRVLISDNDKIKLLQSLVREMKNELGTGADEGIEVCMYIVKQRIKKLKNK